MSAADHLARFRRHWRWLQGLGYPELVRTQSGRQALINMVRDEVLWALAPEPTKPYRLPGWPLRKQASPDDGALPVSEEQVKAWVVAAPFERGALSERRQRALAFLDTFRPAAKSEGAA